MKKFGARSQVVQAVDHLEVKPTSTACQEGLQEEIVAVHVEQDSEVLKAAQHLWTLVQPQQAGLGKFTIQNNAPMQGQTIGDHNMISHSGYVLKAVSPYLSYISQVRFYFCCDRVSRPVNCFYGLM